MELISAHYFKDLIQNDKRKSESLFPQLIRKLALASTINAEINCPYGDDIQTKGFDCTIIHNENNDKTNPIPFGDTIIEIGTNGQSLRKIKGDYEKRKKEKLDNKNNYNLILITSSVLNNTTKLETSKKFANEGIYKSVKILDANDIVVWIQKHLDIALWFLNHYGKNFSKHGILSLREAWSQISDVTTTALSTNLFITDNENIANNLKNELKDNNITKSIYINSPFYGKKHALYFTIASIIYTKDNDLIENVVVCTDSNLLEFINDESSRITVIINCSIDNFTPNSKSKNTYIFLNQRNDAKFTITIPKKSSIVEALKQLKLDDIYCANLAFKCNYNVMVIRRELLKADVIIKPGWKTININDLIYLLLLGKVDTKDSGSFYLLKFICGNNVDFYLNTTLNSLIELEEPPLMKDGNEYEVVSRFECFKTLDININLEVIKKLKTLVKNIIFNEDSDFNNLNISRKKTILLLNSILDGFTLLTTINKENQKNFDSFVSELFYIVFFNIEKVSLLADFLLPLSELSPDKVLDYIDGLVSDKRKDIKLIFDNNRDCCLKFIDCLKNLLEFESTAEIALRLILDIYFIVQKDFIIESITSIFSPNHSLPSQNILPYNKIMEILYEQINEGNDSLVSYQLVKQLYTNFRVWYIDDLKKSYKKHLVNIVNVDNDLVDEASNRHFQFLLQNSKTLKEKEELITICLRQLFKLNKKYFEVEFDSILKLIEVNINSFSQPFIKWLEQFCLNYRDTKFYQHHIDRINNILIEQKKKNESSSSDTSDINSIQLQVTNIIEESDYDSFIPKLVNIEPFLNKDLCKQIYTNTKNHSLFLNKLLSPKLFKFISPYLSYFTNDEIESIINTCENPEIISRLPYTEFVIKHISNSKIENEFWKNVSMEAAILDKNNSLFIFTKFLGFCPTKFLEYPDYTVALGESMCTYILKSLAETFNKRSEDPLMYSYDYLLTNFINKIDSHFENDDIIKCEFDLLPYIGLNNYRHPKYPKGILNYFWKNPSLYKKIILSSKNNTFLSDKTFSILKHDTEYADNTNRRFIPEDVILSDKNKIKEWISFLLKDLNQYESYKQHKLVNSIISNFIPETPTEKSFWFNDDLADIFKFINSFTYDLDFNIKPLLAVHCANKITTVYIHDLQDYGKLADKFEEYIKQLNRSKRIFYRVLKDLINNFRWFSKD